MNFEQQINQKDTKKFATSWFCNAFYDRHVYCHWLHHPLKGAEDVHTSRLDKPEGCDLSFDFRFLHWCANAIVFVQWICGFYVARRSVLLNCRCLSGDHIEIILFYLNLWIYMYLLVYSCLHNVIGFSCVQQNIKQERFVVLFQ